jgi:hypothetical protein
MPSRRLQAVALIVSAVALIWSYSNEIALGAYGYTWWTVRNPPVTIGGGANPNCAKLAAGATGAMNPFDQTEVHMVATAGAPAHQCVYTWIPHWTVGGVEKNFQACYVRVDVGWGCFKVRRFPPTGGTADSCSVTLTLLPNATYPDSVYSGWSFKGYTDSLQIRCVTAGYWRGQAY